MPRDPQTEREREDIEATRTASRYYKPRLPDKSEKKGKSLSSVLTGMLAFGPLAPFFSPNPFDPVSKTAKLLKTPGISFEERFNRFVDIMAPPLPAGSPKFAVDLRDKVNRTLAPALLNKYLPPMPKGLRDKLKKA